VAARSFVLLKNNNQVLPLKKSGTVALIGPLADNKNNMLGTWAPTGDPQLSVPVLEGIKNVAGDEVNILYARGANISDDLDFAKKVNVFGTRIDMDERSPEVMLHEAVNTARRADVVVAVVGEASEMSGESGNRTNLDVPEEQKKLIRALAETGKPLVLVMMSGRPLTMEEENSLADAILQPGTRVWKPETPLPMCCLEIIILPENLP
jgi:beta-glucosidase